MAARLLLAIKTTAVDPTFPRGLVVRRARRLDGWLMLMGQGEQSPPKQLLRGVMIAWCNHENNAAIYDATRLVALIRRLYDGDSGPAMARVVDKKGPPSLGATAALVSTF